MEGIPSPEQIPNKEEVLAKLKEQGLNDETLSMVKKWTEQQEGYVKTARDAILLNIQRIDFYLAVGDDDGAWECAKEAYENAYREGEDDLCQKLCDIYPGLGV